jgi:hypothetical protein
MWLRRQSFINANKSSAKATLPKNFQRPIAIANL